MKRNFTGLLLCLLGSLAMTGCAKDFGSFGSYGILNIDSIAPVRGAAGQGVLIYGTGFSPKAALNKVYFNGVAAVVDSNASYNVLLAYAPANGTTGPVSVVAGGDSVGGPVFTYSPRVPTPVITAVVYNGLFAITGQNFDPANSVVAIGGQVTTGFVYSTGGNGQVLTRGSYTPPANLDNPAPVTVSVQGVSSQPYPYLFYPVITGFSGDTAHAGRNYSIQGTLFGSRSVPSTLRAFAYDGNQRQTYLSPDPTVVSWNTNTIVVTMPNWQSYTQFLRISVIYLEVAVDTKSTYRQTYYSLN